MILRCLGGVVCASCLRIDEQTDIANLLLIAVDPARAGRTARGQQQSAETAPDRQSICHGAYPGEKSSNSIALEMESRRDAKICVVSEDDFG